MRPLSHAVPGALAEIAARRAAVATARSRFAWRAAVGPALERVTAVKLEERVLLVETAGAQWSREIDAIVAGDSRAACRSCSATTTVDNIEVRRA